jgi:hypothetical protein
MGKWVGIKRLKEDDFLDFFDSNKIKVPISHPPGAMKIGIGTNSIVRNAIIAGKSKAGMLYSRRYCGGHKKCGHTGWYGGVENFEDCRFCSNF